MDEAGMGELVKDELAKDELVKVGGLAGAGEAAGGEEGKEVWMEGSLSSQQAQALRTLKE